MADFRALAVSAGELAEIGINTVTGFSKRIEVETLSPEELVDIFKPWAISAEEFSNKARGVNRTVSFFPEKLENVDPVQLEKTMMTAALLYRATYFAADIVHEGQQYMNAKFFYQVQYKGMFWDYVEGTRRYAPEGYRALAYKTLKRTVRAVRKGGGDSTPLRYKSSSAFNFDINELRVKLQQASLQCYTLFEGLFEYLELGSTGMRTRATEEMRESIKRTHVRVVEEMFEEVREVEKHRGVMGPSELMKWLLDKHVVVKNGAVLKNPKTDARMEILHVQEGEDSS